MSAGVKIGAHGGWSEKNLSKKSAAASGGVCAGVAAGVETILGATHLTANSFASPVRLPQSRRYLDIARAQSANNFAPSRRNPYLRSAVVGEIPGGGHRRPQWTGGWGV